MSDKKGFTLIELLGVVVILGVVSVIAVASYNRYIRKSNDTYYDNLADIFKTATLEYFSDNVKLLPQNVGNSKSVSSDVLLRKNYLESFIDTKKEVCEGTGYVIKSKSNKYDYKVCIRCKANDNKWIGDGCTGSENSNNTISYNYEIISNLNDVYYQGKDADGNFGNTNIEVPSALIKVNGQILSTTLSPSQLQISTYVPHGTKHNIYYQYQNEYISKEIKIVDDTPPEFIDFSVKYETSLENYSEKTWTNDNVVVNIDASDWTIKDNLIGSGISKIEYSKDNFKTVKSASYNTKNNVSTASIKISDEGKNTYKFRLVDNAGNYSNVISYEIYIDKKAPTFNSGYPKVVSSVDGYNSKNPKLNINASDNVGVYQSCISTKSYSDCIWSAYKSTVQWGNLSKHLDGSSVTFYISIKDQAGNITKKTVKYTLTKAGLACGTYSRGSSVEYANLDWYVISDSGTQTVLMLKTNSNSGEKYGSSTTWSSSNAKSKVTQWFDSKTDLVFEKNTGYIVNDSTYGVVRIPTKDEGSGIKNDSGTPYWTLTSSGNNMWYLSSSGSSTYTSYSKGGNESNVACYYGYKISSIDDMKRYNEKAPTSSSSSTIASVSWTTGYTNWTYSKSTKKCSLYVTDSSGLGPNTGHANSSTPYLDKGPFCADKAPYYGDCSGGGAGLNFCPNKNGSEGDCTSTYTVYNISKNTAKLGLRPVVKVNERCN